MTNETIDLLQSAAHEISSLRRQNELMSARLEMFDAVMSILHTSVATKNTGMSEDLVSRINHFISPHAESPKDIQG